VAARKGDGGGGAPGSSDRLLEHRLRLTVCVLLSRYERLSFARLKEMTDETDGNLGANLRKLEEAGYLTVTKQFVARKPVTWHELTPAGASALTQQLDALRALIRQARRTETR
jgi:DNA-binding PadR family transcriptional regulator